MATLSEIAKQNSGTQTGGTQTTVQAPRQKDNSGTLGVPAKSARPTNEEREQVILMQTIASALGVAMSSNRDDIANKLKIPVEEVNKIAAIVTDTGGKKTFDGIWGDKTVKAMASLKKLSDTLGTKPINPGKNYKQVHPDNVITEAKANIDGIVDIMKNLGLKESIPQDIDVRPDFYDIIPSVLSPSNVRAIIDDGIAVMPTDLDNIWKFWDFIKGQGISIFKKEDPAKMAADILNNTIVRLAQELKADKYVDESLSPSDFDTAVEWFTRRARWVYQNVSQMYSSQEMRIVDGKEVPAATKRDFDAVKEYKDAMERVYENWQAQKRRIFESKDPAKSELNRNDLRMWPVGKVPVSPGLANEVETDKQTDNNSDTKKTAPEDVANPYRAKSPSPVDSSGVEYEPAKAIVDKIPEGPLDTVIDLSELYPFIQREKYARDWLMKNFARDDISLSDFRRLYPQLLVDSYRMNPNQNVRDFASKAPVALQRILNDAYNTWRAQASLKLHSMPENMRRTYIGIMDRQRNLLQSWIGVLSRLRSDVDRWRPVAKQWEL